MRIAHYAPDLWAPGGIATYVDRLTTAQRSAGHDVLWLCHTPQGDTPLPPDAHVVTASTLYAEARAHGVDMLHAHRDLPTPIPSDRPLIRTMHGHQGGCPSGTRYLRRSGMPCDRTYHPIGCLRMHLQERCGSCRPHKMWRNIRRLQQERAQTQTVLTAAVSMYVQQMMVRAGCYVDNIVVCPSPAPIVKPFTMPPRNSPSVLYAGRIAPEKGLLWLLRAMANVDTAAVLHIAGTGTDAHMQAVHDEIEALALTNRVHFHGWCDDEALTGLMNMAWLVVVPSVWNEPAGLVPLDAAAHGRFVISSSAGGLPEYVAPGASTLVPPNDTGALTRALRDALSDYDRLATCGAEAQHHAEVTFSATHTANAYERLYTQAMSPAASSLAS